MTEGIRIRRVLIATDFSEAAERAARRALAVAPSASTICLLHVVPEGPLARIREVLGSPVDEQVRETAVDSARERMTELRERLAPGFSGMLATEVVEGDPRTAVSAYARTHQFDLVVAGARGEQGSTGLVPGTAAQKVVRTADRPVLLVRGAGSPGQGYRRVLAAVDFSGLSRRALEWALTLSPQAEVSVLNVVELPYERSIDYEAISGEIAERYRNEGRARAQGELEALLGDVSDPRCRSLVREGDPARVVMAQARSLGAELVAVGSRGLGGWSASLMGSVSLRLLQQGESDLLTVGL